MRIVEANIISTITNTLFLHVNTSILKNLLAFRRTEEREIISNLYSGTRNVFSKVNN